MGQFFLAARYVSSFTTVTHEALYGLLRAGMPMRLTQLRAQTSNQLKATFERALRLNIISDVSSSFQTWADEISSARFASLRSAKSTSADAQIGSWEEVLSHVEVTGTIDPLGSGDIEDFLALVQGFEGSEEGFWAQMIYPATGGTPLAWITTGTSVPTEREEWRDRLRWVVDLARLSGRNKTLVGTLKDQSGLGGLRLLAGWTRAQWQAAVTSSDRPTSFSGTTDDYIDALRARLRERFPDQGIRGLDAGTEAAMVTNLGGADLINMLQANADFDLVHDDIESFLGSASFSGYADADAARGPLRAAQRLLRLSSNTDAAETLAGAGVTSAFHIAQFDRQTFVDTFGTGSLTTAEVERVYSAALQQNAAVQLAYAHASPAFYAAEPAATGTTAPDLTGWGGADLVNETSQGLSFCSCTHCASVYSPSAYLFDILSYLGGLPAHGSVASSASVGTALDALLHSGTSGLPMRRPELAHLLLSCENSNTPMPYIDLVNEVLELHVRRESSLTDPSTADFQALQTTEPASDLRILPQWTDDDVYSQVLSDSAEAPWTDLLERERLEARLRLSQLGYARDEYIELFASWDGSAPHSNVGRETLGVSAAMWNLLSTDTTQGGIDDDVAKWFGYFPSSGQVPDPQDPLTNVNWQTALSWVPETLRRVGVTVQELHEALATNFVDPSSTMEIDFGSGDECVIEEANVNAAFTTDTAGRIRQLVALARAVDEPVREVGLAVDTLSSSGVIDGTFLVDFGYVRRVQRALHIGLEEAASLVADSIPNIEAPVYGGEARSGYYEINYVEVRGAADEFQVGSLGSHDLGDFEMALGAVFGISVEELRQLVGDGVVSTGTNSLTMTAMTALHRWSRLASILGVPVVELERFSTETFGLDPFSTSGGSRTVTLLGFLNLWREQSDSEFTRREVDWLLIHSDEAEEEFEVPEEEASAFWMGLQETMLTIREEHLPSFPEGDAAALGVATQLLRRRFQTPGGVEKVRELLHYLSQEQTGGNVTHLDGTTSVGATGQTGAVNSVFLDQSQDLGVKQVLSDTTAAVDLLVSSGTRLTAGAPLYNTVSRYYADHYRMGASYEAIMTAFEEEFGISSDVAAAVIGLTPWTGVFGGSLREYLLAEGYPAENGGFPEQSPGDGFLATTVSSDSDLASLHIRLRKIAMIADRLSLTGEEVGILLDLPSTEYWDSGATWDPNILDLTSLPSEGGSPVDHSRWRSLLAIVAARDEWHADGGELLSYILEGPSGGPSLSDLFDWNSDDLSVLTPSSGLNIDPDTESTFSTSPPAHPLLQIGFWPQQMVGVAKFDGVMRVLAKLSVTASTALEFGENENLPNANATLVQSLRARSSAETFDSLETPLQDELRERRRDALVAWLVGWWGYTGPNDVSARLLLDVQTNVCAMTTRTVLALSSVQTWMQHLLQEASDPVLESYSSSELSFAISEGKAEQWSTWMKWYRVWEANRRVFVHPENWLDPDLRTNATPLFRELDQSLPRCFTELEAV